MSIDNANLEIFIDNLIVDNGENVITGWAYDNDTLKFPKVKTSGMTDEEFTSVSRVDLLENIDKDFPSPELGFTVRFKPVDGELPKLTFTDSEGEITEVEFNLNDFFNPNKVSLKIVKDYLKQFGLKEGLYYLLQMKSKVWKDYERWFKQMQDSKDLEAIRKEIEDFKYKPLISIVMPVYNIDLKVLKDAIDSVKDQLYPNWELCIADDNSTQKDIKPFLEKCAREDSRIKVVYRKKNGHISEATNSALKIATGDYIAFMDDDDVLTPFALYENVKIINENKNVDLIYSDEDFINEYSFPFDPHLKSNWNPRLFFSHNYLTHFIVVKRSLVDKVGELRTKTNGAQDYDFLIRLFDYAKDVYHIPEVLYHWRSIEGSVAKNPEAKNYAYEAGRVAIQDYLDSHNLPAEVKIGNYYGTYEIHRTDEPKVAIITVFDERDKALSLKTLTDLLRHTDYNNFEIIAVNFDPAEMAQFNAPEIMDARVKFVENKRPISLDEIYYNEGQKADADYIVVAKAGISPSTDNWLKELVDQTIFDFNGMATPVFVDQNLRMISAGYNYDEASRDISLPGFNLPAGELGYGFRTALPRNVEANLDECYLVSKEDFKHLKPEGYKGILKGLINAKRIEELGKRVVFNPSSVVVWNGTVKSKDGVKVGKVEKKYHQKKLPKDLSERVILDLTLEPVENYTYLTSDDKLENHYVHPYVNKYRRSMNKDYTGLNGESDVWKP